MAGVEFSKIMVGRKNENAWLLGAVVPGGITGIWRRNLYMGMRTSIFFGIFGYVYQYSTNNNLTNSLLPYAHGDNPNIPTAADPMNRDFSFWNVTTRKESTFANDYGVMPRDPGASWKKWVSEDKTE